MGKPTDVVAVSMSRALWASLLTIYGMGWDEQHELIRETEGDADLSEDLKDWIKEQEEGEQAEKIIVAALQGKFYCRMDAAGSLQECFSQCPDCAAATKAAP